jgi:hypothetical protein
MYNGHKMNIIKPYSMSIEENLTLLSDYLFINYSTLSGGKFNNFDCIFITHA